MMKIYYQKQLNKIKRVFSNEYLMSKIYLYWFIGTMLIFGLLGIYPFSKIFVQKINILQKMSLLNRGLQEKVQRLVAAEDIYKDYATEIDLIQSYLPDDFNLQNYMVEVIVVCSKAGFTVERFTPTSSDENSVNIVLKIRGNGNVTELVKGVETMMRITEINYIDNVMENNENAITLDLKTFITGGSQ